MCTVGDLLDVLGGLSQSSEFLVDDLGSLNGRLGVEFGYGNRSDDKL